MEDLWLPDRSDLYLMQLTAEVQAIPSRVFTGKYPDGVKLADFRLKPRDEEQQAGQTVDTDPWGNPVPATAPDNPAPPSSQERPPGVPPVVTEANIDELRRKIARAFREQKRKLAAEGRLAPSSDEG